MCTVWAQTNSLFGSVIDSSSQVPVPFATIFNISMEQGTSSTLEGDFELEASIGDLIVISCMGYVRDTVEVIGNSPLTIQLIPKTIQLEGITIGPNGISTKQIGYHQESGTNGNRLAPNMEIAMFIPNSTDEHKRIIRAHVRLKKHKFETFFKIRLYYNNAGVPGGEIPLPNKIMSTKEIRRKILSTDFSDFFVTLPPEGLFVSVQPVGFINDDGEFISEEVYHQPTATIRFEEVEEDAAAFFRVESRGVPWFHMSEFGITAPQFSIGLEIVE